MQDIADACGLSRNTVSKVFNGRGSVPRATRELILQKAEELGYGTPVDRPRAAQNKGTIALLTSRLPENAHFGVSFMTMFADRISRAGYTLRIFEISGEEVRQRSLPPNFSPEQTAGIACVELLSAPYLEMISGLGIPTVVIDSPRHAVSTLMSCDYVSMENIASTMMVVDRLISMGAERIGFVGDREHCGSFYERWFAFCVGMRGAGLQPDERICILAPDDAPYDDADWLIRQMRRMPSMPDAFVCANDYLAIQLMGAVKKIGLAIPGDVMITGFDGTPQAALVDPPLTTVEVRGTEIGQIAAHVLLNRIGDPNFPYAWTRVKTVPVWRGSTRQM